MLELMNFTLFYAKPTPVGNETCFFDFLPLSPTKNKHILIIKVSACASMFTGKSNVFILQNTNWNFVLGLPFLKVILATVPLDISLDVLPTFKALCQLANSLFLIPQSLFFTPPSPMLSPRIKNSCYLLRPECQFSRPECQFSSTPSP